MSKILISIIIITISYVYAWLPLPCNSDCGKQLTVTIAYFDKFKAFRIIPTIEVTRFLGGETIKLCILEILDKLRTIEQENLKSLNGNTVQDFQKDAIGKANAFYSLGEKNKVELREQFEQLIAKNSDDYNIVVERAGILYSADSLKLMSSAPDLTQFLFNQTPECKSKVQDIPVTRARPLKAKIGYINASILLNKYFPRSTLTTIQQSVDGPKDTKYTDIYEALLKVDNMFEDKEYLALLAFNMVREDRKNHPEKYKTLVQNLEKRNAELELIRNCAKKVARRENITLVLDLTKVWKGNDLVTNNGTDLTKQVEAELIKVRKL